MAEAPSLRVMNEHLAPWNDVVAKATEGLGSSAARRRRMWGRRFGAWCESNGQDPRTADKAAIDAFVATLVPGPEATRGRSELRALIEQLDPERAGRALGLGNRSEILAPLAGTPLGALVQAVVEQAPGAGRRAVRRSALVRLFTWANEVGVAVPNLKSGDLDQFGRWVLEMGIEQLEVKVVAKDFIELRHSPDGRRILGEPEPIPPALKVQPEAPLKPRFLLTDLPSFDNGF